MNRIIEQQYPVFTLYQALRNQLLELLSDGDLAFTPGGAAPTLGELCRTIGEVEQAYIDSFRTFTQNFDYRHPDPSIAGSVARLQQWYGELDEALRSAVEALSDDDVAARVVDRGGGFTLPLSIQFDVYREALLIFYGKASIYCQAMEKTLTEQWRDWIA